MVTGARCIASLSKARPWANPGQTEQEFVAAASAAPASEDFWHVGDIVMELAEIRRGWRGTDTKHAEYGVEGFPSRVRLAKIADELCGRVAILDQAWP